MRRPSTRIFQRSNSCRNILDQSVLRIRPEDPHEGFPHALDPLDHAGPGLGALDDHHEAAVRLGCRYHVRRVLLVDPGPGVLRRATCAPPYDAPFSRSFRAFAGVNLAAFDAAIWMAAPV